ncbi:hypothetical protein D3C81_1182560 [compost metagenome]
MNATQIRKRLEWTSFQNSYSDFPVQDEDVLAKHINSDMELWFTSERICVLKAYTSNHHFLFNWREDQITISYLLDILPTKYKNNLYFLLVLDWESQLLPEILMEVNRVEKNAKVCRKYVLLNDEDLERVSFLQEKQAFSNRGFDFEAKFKSELLSNRAIDPKVRRIVEGFFKLDQLYLSNTKFDSKNYILKLLKGDEDV